jgi:tetratricopeptide (TPR) repeat protein
MPLVPSADAGNLAGFVHSHRFPGANTALPFVNKDEEQLKATIDFLQDNRLTVDIFALGEPFSAGTHSSNGHSPGHPLETASTFAVGEEQEMAVGGGAVSLRTTPIIAPIDRAGAIVRRGDTVRIDVVVRTRSVGHFFPGGTVDAFDVWLELKAVDNKGRTIFWSGMVEDGDKGPVEKGAHFYRSLQLDGHANPINKRNAWATRAVLYVNLIPPGAADTVHFRLKVPKDCGDTLYLTGKLNYRKFAWWNTQWAFAGERDPSHKDFALSAHHDDGYWAFTGDTSDVSGQIKGIPNLPIVTLAMAEATLKVSDAQAPLAEMKAEPRPEDRERWNDYGIGLLQQGLVKGAEEAFLKVTEIDPAYADGWVNVARARLRDRNIQGAKEALERALILDPDLAKTHYFYALTLKAQGQYDQALEHLWKAAAVYPRDRVVRNEIGRLLFLQSRYAEAIEELKQVLKIDPEDLAAHYNLMLSYQGIGHPAEAQREYQLYMRFKADDLSRSVISKHWQENPEDNNERQPVHEHVSVPLG